MGACTSSPTRAVSFDGAAVVASSSRVAESSSIVSTYVGTSASANAAPSAANSAPAKASSVSARDTPRETVKITPVLSASRPASQTTEKASSRSSSVTPRSRATSKATPGTGPNARRPSGSTTGLGTPKSSQASELPSTFTPGNIDQSVPSAALTTKPAIGLTGTAQFSGDVSVSILSHRPMAMTAQGIGEIAGPAIAIQLEIKNGSSAPIDLGGVNVTVSDAGGTPSVSMSGNPSVPFTGHLATRTKAQAVYVFALATDHKNPITITVGYSARAPIVAFTGNFD